jgi:hypothetical protein
MLQQGLYLHPQNSAQNYYIAQLVSKKHRWKHRPWSGPCETFQWPAQGISLTTMQALGRAKTKLLANTLCGVQSGEILKAQSKQTSSERSGKRSTRTRACASAGSPARIWDLRNIRM